MKKRMKKMLTFPQQQKVLDTLQKKILPHKKYLNTHIKFFSLHGNGDTIRISWEIQCRPYAGFFSRLLFIPPGSYFASPRQRSWL